MKTKLQYKVCRYRLQILRYLQRLETFCEMHGDYKPGDTIEVLVLFF